MSVAKTAIAALLGLCAIAQAGFALERRALSGFEVNEIRIPNPRSYWRESGFMLMSPAIRVSVAAYSGARTEIYLKVGPGGRISTRDGVQALKYPPGSEADRVSLVRYRREGTSGYTVDDVRGTRWDSNGREWFHVYRASGPQPYAPLIGYEWPRNDAQAAREATRRLAQLVRDTLLPNGYRSSGRDVRRFVRLNHCAGCHMPDKPGATTVFDSGPPWATDGDGLYTPLAVLGDEAPVSSQAAFHDPNADDPFVSFACASGDAMRLGRPGGRYFSCAGSDQPMGKRRLEHNDPYAARICAARRYLHSHLDAGGQARYKDAIDACRVR